MDSLIEEHQITDVATLERLYGAPAGAAVEKEITTKAAFAMGDLAYETGSYTFTIVAEGKEARAVKGRYVEVWKKQTDGSWKMYRDIGLPD